MNLSILSIGELENNPGFHFGSGHSEDGIFNFQFNNTAISNNLILTPKLTTPIKFTTSYPNMVIYRDRKIRMRRAAHGLGDDKTEFRAGSKSDNSDVI